MKQVLTFKNSARNDLDYQQFKSVLGTGYLWLCASRVYDFCDLPYGYDTWTFKKEFKLTVHNKRFKHSTKIDTTRYQNNVISYKRRCVGIDDSIRRWIEENYPEDKALFIRIDWT